MKLVVEVVFDVLEERVCIEDDSPRIGMYEVKEISKGKRGRYQTRGGARRKIRILTKKYQAEGWKIRKAESIKGPVALYSNRTSEEITLSVAEKILSKKRLR